MTDLLAKYGVNAEIRENASGDVILRNSTTGTEIRLADFIEFASALGTEANPVPGTSHLESVSIGEANINGPLDAESATVEEAVIGGKRSERHEVLLDTVDTTGTFTIEDSTWDHDLSWSDVRQVRVKWLGGGISGESTVELVVDGDTDGEYGWINLDGTTATSQNAMVILSTSDNMTRMRGELIMHLSEDPESQRFALTNQITFGWRAWSNLSSYLYAGGYRFGLVENTVEISGLGDVNVEIWGEMS